MNPSPPNEKTFQLKWEMKERKKWVRGALIYIGIRQNLWVLKQSLWITFLHKVEDYDFGWHSWFTGLIMSGDKD
jgi:hypothetical protein